MNVDGFLNFNTNINTKGFTKGISGIKEKLGGIKSAVSKFGATIAAAFSTAAIVSFGKSAVESAAAVKAGNSQMEQTFGSLYNAAGEAMKRVAETSGIVQSRLQGVGTSIYAFAKTSGMDSVSALNMMEEALQVTADSAAYYDRSLEETSESLKSFLKGNFENDAALGLSCTETTRNTAANKLYGKSFQELSESQKQLTLLQMVKDANALSGALGQASRESDGWENVIGNLKETWKQFMAVIGQPLLEIAVPAVKRLTDSLTFLTEKARSAVNALSKIFGWETDNSETVSANISTSVEEQDELTESVKETVKTQKKSLAGFDEMNILADNSEKSESDTDDKKAGINYNNPDISEPKIPDMAENLENTVKNIDWYGVGELFAEGVNKAFSAIDWENIERNITEKVNKICDFINGFVDNLNFEYLGNAFAGGINTITSVINAFLDNIHWETIGNGLANGLNQAISKIKWRQLGQSISSNIRILTNLLYGFVTEFDWDSLGNGIGDAVNGWFDGIDFGKLGTTLSEGIKGIFSTVTSTLKTIDFKSIGNKIAEFVNNIDVVGILSKIASSASELVKGTLDLITEFIIKTDWAKVGKQIVDSIVGMLKNIDWIGIVKRAIKLLFTAVGGVISLIIGIVGGILIQIFNALKKVWNSITEKVKELGKNIWNGVLKGIIEAVKNVANWIEEHIFNPFINGFKNIFGINSPSKKMAEMGGYIIDGLFNAISDGIAKINEIFSQMLETIKSIFFGIGDWFREKFSEAWNNITQIFCNIGTWFSDRWNEVTSVLSDVGNWFNDKFQQAWDNITLIFENIGKWFSDRWNDIIKELSDVSNWFKNMFKNAYTNLTEIFKDIGTWFYDRWSDIRNSLSDVGNWFENMFRNAYRNVTEIFKNIGNWFGDRWNDITNVFSVVGGWFSDIFNGAWNNIKTAFSGVKGFFEDVWNGITNVFSHVTNWFRDTFSGAWEAVKNVFSKGGEIFTGITDGIFNTFKTVVNGLIDGINWVIEQPFNAINWALDGIRNVEIADWYPFEWLPSVDVPQIPYLANGTVVPANYGNFLAVLGDNRREAEVVSPLSTIEQAVTNAMKKNGSFGNGEIHVHVELDGREIGRVAVRAVNQDRMRRGG